MSKILTTTDYWEDFSQKYPDPEPIQAFYAEDSILTKIFNIVAIPNIFYEFDTYPFDEKLSEFSTISSDEVDHLYDAQIRKTYDGNEKVKEWLDYLVALLELVRITIKFYHHYKNNSDISGQKLLKLTSLVFVKWFSIHKINVHETTEGETFDEHLIGRISPTALFRKLEIHGEDPKTIGQFHFRVKPTEESIKNLKNHFDFKSVINFKRFGPLAADVTYGGFDPGIDNIGRHSKRVSENFLVEFFYEGKKIDDFKYSIRKRFKKELMRAAKDARDPLTRAGYIGDAEYELLRLIDNFDESEGKPPEHYFRASLRPVPLNIYKSETTTVVPDELDGKQKRIRKADLEHSGKLEGQKDSKDISKEVLLKDAIHKIKKLACKDETDTKIIDSWIDGTGRFEGGDEINYSTIARKLEISDNTVRRRWEDIQKRAKKHPDLRNFFK